MTDEADGADEMGENSERSRLGLDRAHWIAIAFVFVVFFSLWAGARWGGSPDSSPGSSDSGYSSGTDDMSGSGDSTGTNDEIVSELRREEQQRRFDEQQRQWQEERQRQSDQVNSQVPDGYIPNPSFGY